MMIDGKAMAEEILAKLKLQVEQFKITPTLAVILVGDNPASISYIRQKQKAAEKIGANLILDQLDKNTSFSTLLEKYNHDPKIHGLIVQRPLPAEIARSPSLRRSGVSGRGDCRAVLDSIKPEKDVDGFVPGSKFEVPVAKAVFKILQEIHPENDFDAWLRGQKIVIIGRGETAGKPINTLLQSKGCTTSVISSQTPHPEKIMQTADIIISCVGKARVVKPEFVKPGAILISVGIWRDDEGKLHGDYEEVEIKEIASFYTPTPGGVGPVNVACLMENLVASFHSSARF